MDHPPEDLPDWVKEYGTCGLGSPIVFMLERPLLSPEGVDPGFPFWVHWHDSPTEQPARWVVGGLPQHRIISREPWHIAESLLCAGPGGCGLHGFIHDDEWTAA